MPQVVRKHVIHLNCVLCINKHKHQHIRLTQSSKSSVLHAWLHIKWTWKFLAHKWYMQSQHTIFCRKQQYCSIRYTAVTNGLLEHFLKYCESYFLFSDKLLSWKYQLYPLSKAEQLLSDKGCHNFHKCRLTRFATENFRIEVSLYVLKK